MKTKIIFCFFVIGIFFAGQASAKIADVTQKDVKALTSFANEQSWQSLVDAAMKKGSYINCPSGKPSGKCVTFDFLTNGMYAHATKHPDIMELVNPENRTKDAYIKLTRKQNSMPETGGAIPVEDLKELVFSPDERGIYYAREGDRGPKMQVAQAPEPVKTDAVPAIVTVRPVAKPEASKPSEAEVQIRHLQKQIAEMKKALVGNEQAKVRLTALENQLSTVLNQIKSLSSGQIDLAKNQKIISDAVDVLRKDLTDLQIFYSNELIRVEDKVNNTYQGLELVHGSLEEIFDSVTYNQRIIVVSLSGAIILLAVYFWFANRSTRKIAEEAKGIAEKADGKAGFATSLVKKQEADLGLVIESVDGLLAVDSEDCKGFFICDEAKLSKEFTMNLPVGESIEVIVRFSEKDWRIIFFRASETHFNVIGIKRTKSAKSSEMDVGYLTNLADFIRKAYKDHRISAKEVEEAIAA